MKWYIIGWRLSIVDDIFRWNERLGIALPELQQEWEGYSEQVRAAIVTQWEIIRGTIPDRVFAYERLIHVKQAELFEEEDFETSCCINSEIAELASRINDLHIWYRINQEIEPRRHS
ncbi:hypothetical protein [Paenibacillus nasutitermitis]|uniref:hypothetical protein n=1 Tax=Paenibacillus nasutitermitis TaxID=1652958 RepID=UPI001E293FED|nr:hypothetical protein [Paenibacillus nasutitermitis]